MQTWLDQKRLALLVGTFLLKLGALEAVLNFIGIKTFQVAEGNDLGSMPKITPKLIIVPRFKIASRRYLG